MKKETKAAVGVGLALAAAAAAGAYFLYGSKEGAKRRQKIKGWMIRMKGEVVEQIEKAKDLSEDTYNKIVENVAEKYKKAKNIDPVDLAATVKDLKRHWANIRKHVGTGTAKKGPARKRKA